jgi:WD40 repeat protein
VGPFLRLQDADGAVERHDGEVFGCTYTPDGANILTGGWDGFLRLWDAGSGSQLMALEVSPKPLSSCAVSPDGKQWLSGSMEGLLAIWDGVSHQSLQNFMAHTRPISAIAYAPDGEHLATASWDRLISLRKVGVEREGRSLAGHSDIVAGCRYLPDGKHLLSWSHDATVRLWDVETGREVAGLKGHTDRVNTATLSPHGRAVLTGSRDGTLRFWDLTTASEVSALKLGVEVRACFHLLDGESVVVADGAGRLFLLQVPSFEVKAQLETEFKVQTGELSPSGMQLALGGEDGRVHLVAVEGFENASLVVTASQSIRQDPTFLSRLMGKPRLTRTYQFTCPACRQKVEATSLPSQPTACPKCRRRLQVHPRAPLVQGM